MTQSEVINYLIPYRLQALETLQFAWVWSGESSSPRHVTVLEGDKVKLNCNVAALANPMIEAGLIHARALLEFMGLTAEKRRLVAVKNRRADDFGIEKILTQEGKPLPKISPEIVFNAYNGPSIDAESSLVAIFEWSNKGHAHVTSGLDKLPYTELHLENACKGIPILLHENLYAKLGLPFPNYPSAFPQD